jgi:formylglycine-generating enzyme
MRGGLYDMHGNVLEWCSNFYGDYPSGALTDPIGPASGSPRVSRGGSWIDGAKNCRSAFRRSSRAPRSRHAYLGFRVVLSPSVARDA